MRHSVVLDFKKCRGCTTCIKNCPTEAIRVRSGKATILPNRCIDCGTCIRVCPHKAVKSVCDDFSALKNYRYTIAIPDPALYGQFQNLDDVDIVLNGLLELGFDHVYEASAACEMLSGFARERILKESDRPMPEISPACPAVVRLISIRFPKLINHIAPVITPSEFAAITARQQAVKDTGLSPDEIGVFSIVPCSSLVTAAHSPVGLAHPVLDGAFAIRDVYLALLGPMKKLDKDNLKPLSASGILGVGWAYVGGESAGRLRERYVAVDGIDNVIRMLEDIEDGRLPEADFVELRACTQGCVGGCLSVGDRRPDAAEKTHAGPACVPHPVCPRRTRAGHSPIHPEAGVPALSPAGPGSGPRHGEDVPHSRTGKAAARPALRLLRGPLLSRLRRGCGDGPGQRGRLHL